MYTIKKFTLAAFAAAFLLALIAGSAAALRSIESNLVVITSLARRLVFEDGSNHNVVCEVGITLSLNSRNSSKTPGIIGRASLRVLGEERSAERCTGGKARVVGGPFTARYNSFAGNLPDEITSEKVFDNFCI